MKIIIDTNILITDPSVLTQKKESLTLVIPAGVKDELISIAGRKREVRGILNLLDSSVENGIIQIDDAGIQAGLAQGRLSFTDLQTISLALKYKNQNDDVVIASLDREVQSMAEFVGIPIIDLKQLKLEIADGNVENQDDFEKAKIYNKKQLQFLFANFAVGIVGSLLANLTWQYFDLVLGTIRVWGTVVLIIFTSLFLYWFRGRHRLSYGVTEFVFGLIMTLRIFFPDFDYKQIQIISFLQIIAGIYVMVRGMDNFGKGIQDTRFEYSWNKFSNETKIQKNE
jgi:rRNA maturation endonuclease Nob1/uncharacterized membrane protein YeaQ/YmgE (transglycosylase-associated protein family)